jgi:virginiamycin B lyase
MVPFRPSGPINNLERILMRLRFLMCLCAAITAAQPAHKKETSHAPAAPSVGIRTPGVQIPFASLKPEAEFATTAEWLAFTDAPLVGDRKSLFRIDAKKNELGAAVASLNDPCGGMVSAFSSLWIPTCGDRTITRIDPKTWKVTATVSSGTGTAKAAIAATADSVWILSDNKTTLSRIDPEQNGVVAELRLDAGCNTVTFGEAALWVTCPGANRVVRVDAEKNLVDKRIEVSGQPQSLAIGESSVWVYCKKEGKVDRIDPKTNKVTKSIELGVSGVDGAIAVGQGSVWASLAGFPLVRIDPVTEKVVQQFWGPGGGAIYVGQNSIWLANLPEGKVWRVDPKRVTATLAE